jgi:microcystin-dependent protein
MKTIISLLLCLFYYSTIIAQSTGISVQGIARDAQKAALVDIPLTFTFEIQEDAGGTSYYKEDVLIKTDPYGVFSHIIGTGNILAGSGAFIDIPFRQTPMKLIISVLYNGANVVVSNDPFQYAPYAISAENGVPTGTIVAFAGAEVNIPSGWVLCDGRALSGISGSKNLIALIGANVPDLQGMFLRGTGNSALNGQPGPALGVTQNDGLESHLHNVNINTSTDGNHSHTTGFYIETSANGGDGGGDQRYNQNYSNEGIENKSTTTNGAHTHNVSGNSANTGITETRPVNYGVNYIIKL